MSNIVEQINDAFESTISATLGVGWKELDHKFLVEKNNFRQNTQRYGVRPLSGFQRSGVTRVYTVDHVFEVILTQDYRSGSVNDEKQREAAFLLYDKFDDIIRDIFLKKLGISTIVLNIPTFSVNEIEFLEEKVAVLRAEVTITYRNTVT